VDRRTGTTRALAIWLAASVAGAPLAAQVDSVTLEQAIQLALDVQPAMVQARSLGAWSDGLRLSTALLARGLRVLACTPMDPPAAGRIRLVTVTPLYSGDLIELTGDPSGTTRLFARIDGSGVGNGTHEVQATLCAAFAPLTPTPTSPPGQNVQVSCWKVITATR